MSTARKMMLDELKPRLEVKLKATGYWPQANAYNLVGVDMTNLDGSPLTTRLATRIHLDLTQVQIEFKGTYHSDIDLPPIDWLNTKLIDACQRKLDAVKVFARPVDGKGLPEEYFNFTLEVDGELPGLEVSRSGKLHWTKFIPPGHLRSELHQLFQFEARSREAARKARKAFAFAR